MNRAWLFIVISLSGLVMSLSGPMARGQVWINEFSAANSVTILDPDFNESADWIELYNAGSLAVDVGNFYISDNFAFPAKWQLPANQVIEPGDFLVIWADGRNTGLHAGFKLAVTGEEIGLYSPGLVLLDSISFAEQQTDISFGRTNDGSPGWSFFQQPTPGSTNSTETFQDFVSAVPEFSPRGGIYSSSLSVGLFTDFGGEIRYTSDGSEPGEGSPLFTSPIPVNFTTVLRARIFEQGKIPGPVITHSYFIDENSVDELLPVVSIATAPENLWDPELGIYVQDFKPLWEIPINIELFENNGTDRAAFNERAGAKINGLYSWQLPQKMLGIYFKKQYGTGNLAYPLTHQRKRDSYKSFALRASGSDWSYTLFRDILGQHATLLNMDLDVMGFRPAVAYFNGAYMGIQNIREKVDDDFIEKRHHMEPGSFDLVENEDFAEAGDLVAYGHLIELFDKDLSVDANYNALAELVDIENLTDFLITEMATANTSIEHNVMAWKPKEGGKWKWVVMDLDRGFFNPGNNLINFYQSKGMLHLNDLIRNPSYLNYFAGRLSSQLYTSFHPERMGQLIDEHTGLIEAEIYRHIQRWEGTTSSYGNAIPSEQYWRDAICDLRSFTELRPKALLNDLQRYGLSETANLSLVTDPADAGSIRINNLEVPGTTWSGPYVKDLEIRLKAEAKPGHRFLGWSIPGRKVIIPMGSVWEYLDTGENPGTQWRDLNYDDSSWKPGAGELGYGDGDESTVISFGGDSQHKYTTSFFRKVFTLTGEDMKASHFAVSLVMDDGVVAYLNGTETLRSNMACGDINYQTLALSSLSGSAESASTTYLIPAALLHEGENIWAVEVHQGAVNSADLSFDLEFSGYGADPSAYVSLSPDHTFSLDGDLMVTAVFEQTSNCILPDIINGDLTLDIACSPYLAQGDVLISEDATLTIEPGVEIWMPAGANMLVHGAIHADGTADKGILFRLHPDDLPGSWGVLSFRNTTRVSSLNYVTVEDASQGPDPVSEVAAISAFHADLVLDHLTLENNHGNPISARYSDIRLSNSSLHSAITGDLINVKYGHADVSNCRFTGNDQPDNDAIDYDEVENGTIRNCYITGFLGLNSDAVDLGENASGILIDSIFVYRITDKGVSAGQRTTATVRNSVFVNCNMGVAVKDSSRVWVEQSVFYGNGNAVACFEKNLGQAGGNARITNSILSNAPVAPVYADPKSTLQITYSVSDTKVFPEHPSNKSGNPLFINPTFYDFGLLPGSPGILTGMKDGTPVDAGFPIRSSEPDPSVMICQIYLNGANLDLPEFIGLYNPSTKKVDLSGYAFTKGIDITIPDGVFLEPEEILYLSSDLALYNWAQKPGQVLKWESGRLANEGEALQLVDSYGIVVDHLAFENNGLWPAAAFTGDVFLQLISPALDNHFPESWKTEQVFQVLGADKPELGMLRLYPNPARDIITIEGLDRAYQEMEIYDLTGQLLDKVRLNGDGKCVVDLSGYNAGMLLIKVGYETFKVMIIK
ncbi:MAG: CotH kinase family protein [Bacteroidota bacterium]